MTSQQSPAQKETVERVMHEFKHDELETHGRKVKNPKQAIAIALHEAGASRDESAAQNRANLRRTKAKERQGKPAPASEHKGAVTRAELHAKARQQNLPGRSRMTKAELERALHA